ncbi:MAG: sigma 54-interacting transcriptional regulator [Deltaproteobacteria bacterium]|nr:sigma 54-interacting transcriptional regulator [Myxococcales bacterium]MDP3214391.1 sigma 54-interacting transcriptional regulator [Deltaproteobacteria bacterium]
MSLRLDRLVPSPAQGTAQRSTVPPASEPVAPGGRVSVRLWVEEPGRSPRLVVVPAGVPVRVGRSYAAEVPVADPEVSRFHSVLWFSDGRLTVADHHSSNGTFLRGLRVGEAVEVGPAAAIQIGSTLLVRAAPETRPARTSWGSEASLEACAEPVAFDPAMAAVVAEARRLATTDAPVWIEGEVESGRGTLARAIHRDGGRASRPLIRANCATMAEGEFAGVLLGSRRDDAAGTGRALGLVERAEGGTLLLENIDDLTPADRDLIRQVIQTGAVTPLGDSQRQTVDVRVVVTSRRPPSGDGADEALHALLRGAVLRVPPLRERPMDVVPLVRRFLAVAGDPRSLAPAVAAALQAYGWPGNVREVRDAIGFARSVAEDGEITLDDLPRAVCEPGDEPDREELLLRQSQREVFERNAIVLALTATGNVSRAARILEVPRSAVLHAMRRYGLGARTLGVTE